MEWSREGDRTSGVLVYPILSSILVFLQDFVALLITQTIVCKPQITGDPQYYKKIVRPHIITGCDIKLQ